MKVNLYIENNRIVGYQTLPIVDDLPCIELDTIPDDLISGEYTLTNNTIEKVGFTPERLKQIENSKLEELRQQREILLNAFDKWEKAVLRGREAENTTIMQWFKQLLDLNESAFDDANIPERIKYYL